MWHRLDGPATDQRFVGSDPFFSRSASGSRARRALRAAGRLLEARVCRHGRLDELRPESFGGMATDWPLCGPHLNGTRPEALPVQLQNKYELVINMKTVKALADQPTLAACPLPTK